MTRPLFSRPLLAVVTLTALAAGACGDDDDDDSGSYEASCERACAQILECESTTDVETCAADCRNEYAAIGPKLNASFLTALDTCVAELSCPELALSAFVAVCTPEARALVTASSSVTTFCDAVTESSRQCVGFSLLGTGDCIDAFKVYNEAAIAEASACLEKSCDQRRACAVAALAL